MRRNISLVLLILIAQLLSFSIAAQEKQKAELYIETGHTSDINSIAFSPDGKTLASGSGSHLGSDDNTIKLWDVASGRELETITGHNKPVSFILFSADSKVLAAGGLGSIIKFWDVTSGQELKLLEGNLLYFYSAAFSPDGKMFAAGDSDGAVKLWDLKTGKELKTLTVPAVEAKLLSQGQSLTFSLDSRMILSGDASGKVSVWNIASEKIVSSFEHHSSFEQSVFRPDGKIFGAVSNFSGTINLWNVSNGNEIIKLEDEEAKRRAETGMASSSSRLIGLSPDGKIISTLEPENKIVFLDATSGKKIRTLSGHDETIYSITFSPDGKTLASGSSDKTIKLWHVESGREIKTLKGTALSAISVNFSPDSRMLAGKFSNENIKLWSTKGGQEIKTFKGDTFVFSRDSKTLATGSSDNVIRLWNSETGDEITTFKGDEGKIYSMDFSLGGRQLASGSSRKIILWDAVSGKKLRILEKHDSPVFSVAFSNDGKLLGSVDFDLTYKLWDVESGKQLISFQTQGENRRVGTSAVVPGSFHADTNLIRKLGALSIYEQGLTALTNLKRRLEQEPSTPDGRFQVKRDNNGKLNLFDVKSGKLLITLFALAEDEWIVTTPEGRFDTNKSLDQIEGLHWVINDEILKPLPLDIFMRQYYEPGLLQRVFKCNEDKSCEQEFKPLPSIADINRVQPKVAIREIKLAANANDLVDVTVEVESVTDDLSISATKSTKEKPRSSGVFDLRLFRDGQLVDVSTPPDRVAKYNEKSVGVSNAEDTVAWREANNLVNLKDLKFDIKGKAAFTFHKVKLPRNGEKQIEFSVYAFNEDRVKSNTDRRTFELPALSSAPLKGRAYLITIGVNASNNRAYNLRYAVNDARKIQTIVGKQLNQSRKYTKVIQVPLISDNESGKVINTARKDIIKGVFSLLAGHRDEAKQVIRLIPNAEQIKEIEPEDTLIIAFSGHGYADQNGIFYMLPADVLKDTKKLTAEALKRTISSDELSLWMRGITAKEMLMIVDACHSAAAVQGKDFKPGPMGSRGLGQLAYDKGMRILAATQADNVAIELEPLQQGLLSYALVKEGIEEGKADTQAEFEQLTAAEWLGFAVKAVPQLYEDVLTGKKSILIDGKKMVLGQKGTDESIDLSGNQQRTSGVNLQQPSLFDFRRKKISDVLFSLPQ